MTLGQCTSRYRSRLAVVGGSIRIPEDAYSSTPCMMTQPSLRPTQGQLTARTGGPLAHALAALAANLSRVGGVADAAARVPRLAADGKGGRQQAQQGWRKHAAWRVPW